MLRSLMMAGALALIATPAMADPDKDESGNHSSWDRAHWDRDDDRWDRDGRFDRRDDRRRFSRRLPAGHLPPAGSCRVWLRDRPAGHQPPPMSCREARRYANRFGGRVIRGGPNF